MVLVCWRRVTSVGITGMKELKDENGVSLKRKRVIGEGGGVAQ